MSKTLQGSTVVKAVKTVKRGAFTDFDIVNPEEYLKLKKHSNERRKEWKKIARLVRKKRQ